MAVKRNAMAQALAKPQGASVQRIAQVPQGVTVQRVNPMASSSFSDASNRLRSGQEITESAIQGKGFDPRGGWGVAAAQIATAGIGAWAQNRARKDLAEIEVNRQTQLSSLLTSKGYTPESANAIASLTTPESGASLIGAFVNQDMAKNDPASQLSLQKTQAEIAKLNAETNKAYKEARTAGTPSAPAGYSYNPDGSLRAIKGGPADKTSQPLSQDAAKTLTVANDGLSALDNIEKQFTNPKTGDFLKRDFGSTSMSSKYLPTIAQSAKAQEFTAYQANLVDTIGRLRSGGAIGKDEESRFLKMVPEFGDKPETFKTKINQLKTTFNSVQNAINPASTKSQNQQQVTSGQTSMPPQSGFKILNVRDK